MTTVDLVLSSGPWQPVLELLTRSTLIVVLSLGLATLLGRRQPRKAHGILTAANLLLLLVPLTLMGMPPIEVDLAPAALSTAIPATSAASPTLPAGDGAPWSRPSYHRPSPVLPIVVLVVYLLGVTGRLFALGRAQFRMRLWLQETAPAPSHLSQRAASHGWERPRCRIHPRARVPFTLGLMQPAVVLPAAAANWPAARLDAVLLHELAHVRHRDALWQTVAAIAAALFWFHPGVWLLQRRTRALAEFACDAEAIAGLGGRRRYVDALVAVAADLAPGDPARAQPAASMAAACLTERVERALRCERPPSLARDGRVTAIAALLGAGIVFTEPEFRPQLSRTTDGATLLAMLESPAAEARATALFRLSRWQGREDEVAPILARHLGDDTPTSGIHRWSYPDEGWGPARHIWLHPSPGETAALGLASMGAAAAPLLEARLGDPDATVRRNAAWALGELRHPRGISRSGVERLIGATGDPDPRVRAAAAWSLGDIGARRATPRLRSLLGRETDPRTRREARAALDALERGLTLEALRQRRDAAAGSLDRPTWATANVSLQDRP